MAPVTWNSPKSLKLSRPFLFGLVLAIRILENLKSGPWLRQSYIISGTVRYIPLSVHITSAGETKNDLCLPIYRGPNSLPANSRRDRMCTRACDTILRSTSTHIVVPPQFPMVLGKRYTSVYAANDGISRAIPRFGACDVAKTLMLLDELKRHGPNSVLLDIGANIGWFSLAAAYAGYRVTAGKFEELNPFRR